jgi:hypothetical protein
MKTALRFVSAVALVGTILPPILYVGGVMDLDQAKLWMLGATVAWFAATPFWMK